MMPPAIPAPPIPQRPNFAPYHYHTYNYVVPAPGPFAPSAAVAGQQFYSLVEDLEALRQNAVLRNVPNIFVGPVPGGAQTLGGNNTLMVSFGNLANAANCPTVVITGGIHAREWIAAEFAYLLAEYLIGNYPIGIGVPANPRVAQLKNLVDTRRICIIPMLNPDGNLRSVFGVAPNDRNWRKNIRVLPVTAAAWQGELAPLGATTLPFRNVVGPPAASYETPDFVPVAGMPPPLLTANYRLQALPTNATGVDGNRNMHTPGWGYDSAPYYDDKDPASDSYFGTSPGGERENSNLQLAMAAAAGGGIGGNIAVSIDYHSFGRMILYPDEMPAGGPAADYRRTGALLRALILDNAGLGYTLGGVGVGYLSTGTIDSYGLQTHQARAFTIELDPADVAGGPGFALPEAQIQSVFETNIRGALAAIAAPLGPAARAAAWNSYQPWLVHGAGNQVP